MNKLIKSILIIIVIFCVFYEQAIAAKTLQFSGYSWTIKNGSNQGPGPNNWSADSSAVYVDKNGALHLSVKSINGKWYSTEVYLSKSLGYGRYEFDMTFSGDGAKKDLLDRNLIAAAFIYANDNNEFDLEYSYWSDYKSKNNTNYSAQPYTADGATIYIPGNYPLMPVTGVIDWTPTGISYSTLPAAKEIQWTYVGTNNFQPGQERVHINFWQNQGKAPKLKANSEFIINNFRFTPYVGEQ